VGRSGLALQSTSRPAGRCAFAGAVCAALVAAFLTLGSGTQARADTSNPGFSLSPSSVMWGEPVHITGPGLAALRADYTLYIGNQAVSNKDLDTWNDSEISFIAHVDPGMWAVSLETSDQTIPAIQLGDVTVVKYVLPPSGTNIVPGSIGVRLAPQADPATVAQAGDRFERMAPSADASTAMGRWYTVQVPAGQEAARIQQYAALSDVEIAQYDGVFTEALAPNDPFYTDTEQWNVRKTRQTAGWEARTTARGVAVLDTGVRATHEDLNGRVTYNRDETGTGLAPCNGHGTGVASVAGASTNNGRGIAGGGWTVDAIGSYKVLGRLALCEGATADIVNGINQAVADGFRILNMSFGSTSDLPGVQNAVNDAWNAGAFLVASAGNNSNATPTYPAAYNNVFSVASTDENDARSSFSNYGNWVDIAAPGNDIWMAWNGSDTDYELEAGTSFAAPLVASTAALLRAAGVTNINTAAQMLSNGDPVDWDPTRAGEVRLNTYRALVPGQGCIRDIPVGAWVSVPGSATIYQVAAGGVKRHVYDSTVMDSWAAWNDVVPICPQRLNELASGPDWGYRPGRLVRDTSSGKVYLITTDGSDRGLPEKRWITTQATLFCFGWSWANVIDGTSASLAVHPTGADISTCEPGVPRLFPNGSLVMAPNGVVYMIEAGDARHVKDPQVYASWFSSGEAVPLTQVEADLLLAGPDWGFRQGRRVEPAGDGRQFVITDDGSMRAQGSKRWVVDSTTLSERGFASIPLSSNVSAGAIAIHPDGAELQNADNMS